MEIEDYIDKIINDGNVGNMHKLSEILEDVMEKIKLYDEDCYKEYEMQLYKMAYGNTLNKSMAEDIVINMKPYGMRWSLEDTQKIQEEYGVNDIKPIDFFIVLNSAFNDYKNLFEDNMDMYVTFTVDFINDEDAKKDKIFLYYTTIPE